MALSLLALWRQKETESKSIQKETLVRTCLKVFFKCCYVFTLSPVSSSFGNVENNIQLCAVFVCPFPCGKHGFFLPCSLQTFSQLSFSCLPACQRRHWWYHSKSTNEEVFLTSCCSLGYYTDFASYQIWHIYWFIYFLRKADASPLPPPLPTNAEGGGTEMVFWRSGLPSRPLSASVHCCCINEFVDPVFWK